MATGKKRLNKDRFYSKKPHMKYWYCYFLKYARIKENVILLESFHGKTISDSSLVFAREIQRLYPGKYKVFFASEDVETHKKYVEEAGLDVELLPLGTMKYVKILATAKYIISNASLPIYYIRREGQYYLQTWHGTPLKTLGKEMRMGIESMYNVQHNFLQASHLTFPNDFTKDAIMRDYNLEKLYTGKVVMAGYPRNQVFMQEGKAEETRRKLGLEGKTVYAYMPTWRGTSNRSVNISEYIAQVKKIFDRLDEILSDDQLFYVNFHPIVKDAMSLKEYKHILPFPGSVDNYTFLNCADALVTDYSSVFFDFSLTKKPVLLFMYDYDQYMQDRGMYMDVRDLPFRQCFTEEEFYKCMEEDSCLSDSYEDTDYYREFFNYDSVDVTEKLLKMILEGQETDLKIIDYASNKERDIRVFFPEKSNSDSDFMTLAKVASGDNDVVFMYRGWFKNSLSQLLYDKYNYDFNYIITTNTPPRTYLEQLLKNLGNEKAEKAIHDRDMERCFPGLKITEEVTDYGYNEEGYQQALGDMLAVEARVKTGRSNVIEIEHDHIEGYEPVNAVFLDTKNARIYCRPLTEEEKQTRCVKFDFTEVVESLLVYNLEQCRPVLACVDKDGNEILAAFTDKKKAATAEEMYRKGHPIGLFYTPAVGTFSLPEDYRKRKFITTYRDYSEEVRARLSGYNMDRTETEQSLLPFLDEKSEERFLAVRVCNRMDCTNYSHISAKLKSFKVRGSKLIVKTFIPYADYDTVVGGAMKFDSVYEDLEVPVDMEKTGVSNGVNVTLTVDISKKSALKPLRWHLRIVMRLGEGEYLLRIENLKVKNRIKLKLGNNVAEHTDGMVAIPYTTKKDVVKVMYREKTEGDTRKSRAREMVALILSRVMGWSLKKKNIYIVYEKFSKSAQDNSYYFFKYCREQLPEEENKRIFYVIDKKSTDYQVVKQYEPYIIDFMSIKHMLYAMNSKLLVSTDAVSHLYSWSSRPSYVEETIRKKKVLFLQHGVTALKRVDQLFGKKGTSPMKYFVTTSKIEQDIVVSEFGYVEDTAPIVGFARWDVLENKEDKDNRFILVMPTWRAWLENADDEEFLKSDYYENYCKLLRDKRLTDFLEKRGLGMVLYLHPKFAGFIDTFRGEISERIELVPFGSKPLNDIMMCCAMLVTDYSSVCWDVLYMDKPVVFYQFDCDVYQAVHGSYIDLKTDLPCPRTESIDDVITFMEDFADRGFVLTDEYKEKSDKFFMYKDDMNSKRTYDFLIYKEENRVI